ncbi:MAG: UvrD-helicase domain-containing protein [Chloroflexi bacterium]|nr:UvrD-helicase domain-containing protein [Chloroflexota bacterium]MCI0574652.1 UvrD-helicase domain-containing protein [Chloroflexota bacterium]MCI0649066.1 UvrD-helicase domain-containing protein [Chloroflexota bacterium]MCI0730521.1 UvrD-helicase domain-containing protein [Chloroflexota bacterium]
MNVLQGLNQAQRAAVTAGRGPILVLAGPGSGKTRVLTYRIVYLVQEMQVSPWNIMAVTFTNKAAREMQQRLETALEGRLRGLTIGTFHATCARILRREAQQMVGYDADFVIFDTDDQRQVVRQALQELNLDEKKFSPNKMLAGIGAAKNELITPEQYAASNYISEVTHRVYQRYQEILLANNAMDFDDLLMNIVLLFDQRPDVLERYQQKYEHILVDEFQDTNTAQYALLKRLAAGHGNIFVVGDSDQSIYRWRGADFRNINRFRRDYPEAQMILLEQNYRSTQIILDAAKAIIRHNKDRVEKELFTERQGGARIVVHEFYNEVEEADMVVATIERLMLQGLDPGDFAVMYRTNSQSRVIEEAFLRAGLKYRLVGATRFYARREIKDLIAYLRLVHNPADSISFNRIINTPPRGIGAKTQGLLHSWAAGQGLQPAEALLRLVSDPDTQHPFAGRATAMLAGFGQMLREWLGLLRNGANAGDLLDAILQATDYRGYVDDGTEEGQDRWANVMELRGVAIEYGEVSLSEFLENVALISDVDDLEEEASAPTLLTLHAAKGLEFPAVFITGLEDGVLPHSRSLDDGEELAEERRLFYVGLTRAKDQLYLSYAFRRNLYGESAVTTPSRFLLDIPDQLLEGIGSGRSSGQRREETKRRASDWNWASPASTTAYRPGEWRPDSSYPESKSLPEPSRWTEPAGEPRQPAATQTQFRTGQKVSHAKFGEGIVIESKSTGNDEEVVVAFAGLGIKKLVASMARLEIRE